MTTLSHLNADPGSRDEPEKVENGDQIVTLGSDPSATPRPSCASGVLSLWGLCPSPLHLREFTILD